MLVEANAPPRSRVGPYLFLHGPKTGGITVRAILEGLFYESEILRISHEDPLPSREVLENAEFIVGHVLPSFAATMPWHPKILTMLRHPLQRMISSYRYWRSLPIPTDNPKAREAVELAQNLSLEDFLTSNAPVLFGELHNFQCRWLGYNQLAPIGDLAMLRRAKEVIQSAMWFGVLEHLPQSIQILEALLGLPPQFIRGRINASPEGSGDSRQSLRISQGTLTEVRKRNTYDFQLYEWAAELLKKRAESLSSISNTTKFGGRIEVPASACRRLSMADGLVSSGWWPRAYAGVWIRYAFRGTVSKIYTNWPLSTACVVGFWIPYVQPHVQIEKLRVSVNANALDLIFLPAKAGVIAIGIVPAEFLAAATSQVIEFDTSMADPAWDRNNSHAHSEATTFALADIVFSAIGPDGVATSSEDESGWREAGLNVKDVAAALSLGCGRLSSSETIAVEAPEPISGGEAAIEVDEAKAMPTTEPPPSVQHSMMHDQARIITFYLPQYHPIPENDSVWGDGFTEWDNVRRAKPNFPSHYQPRVPAELGYYDLRDIEVMLKQASLAKQHGVDAFCYYYYNFSGRRVLEMPLERVLSTGKPDIPFCVCWANENWTTTWRDEENAVLLSHEYSEDTDTLVIMDLIRYFRHPLYLKVNGKPILLVYRARAIPKPQETTERWRTICRRELVGEIHLVDRI